MPDSATCICCNACRGTPVSAANACSLQQHLQMFCCKYLSVCSQVVCPHAAAVNAEEDPLQSQLDMELSQQWLQKSRQLLNTKEVNAAAPHEHEMLVAQMSQVKSRLHRSFTKRTLRNATTYVQVSILLLLIGDNGNDSERTFKKAFCR